MAPIIYLVESDQKLAQEIVNPAIKNGFEIYIFSRFSDLLKDLQKNLPSAIFLRDDLLPQSPFELRLLSHFYTLVYGRQFDPDKRIFFYNLGVKRVVDGVFFKPATVSLLLKHYLYSQKEMPANYLNKMVKKSLNEQSLLDLLQQCRLEKKSVSCKMIDNEWSAKLRIHNGLIEYAFCSGNQGTAAVIEILHHHRGEMFLNYFSDSHPAALFDASTQVHILEYKYQLKLLTEFQEKCGQSNPVFSRVGEAKDSSLSDADKTVLKILSHHLSLRKLLKLSNLSFLQTFRSLERLFKDGIVTIQPIGEEKQQFSEEDFELFHDKFFRQGQKFGQILVLGSTESAKHSVIDRIAQSVGSKVTVNNSVEIMELDLEKYARIYFVALPLNDQIFQLLSSFITDLMASVFIVDLAEKKEMDYQKYFLRQFLNQYSMPLVVGVINFTGSAEETVQQVKRNLEIPSHVPVSTFSLQNFSEIRELFMKLTESSQS